MGGKRGEEEKATAWGDPTLLLLLTILLLHIPGTEYTKYHG